MNEYKTYSVALNKCVFDTIKMRDNFNDEHKEVLDKSLINRMYYALYNRIVAELSEVQNTTANKHQQIYNILIATSNASCVQINPFKFQDCHRFKNEGKKKHYRYSFTALQIITAYCWTTLY